MFWLVFIGLGNERASTLLVVGVLKTQARHLACDDCIGEEKSPLYIFIYASGADVPGRLENFLMRC
jgi:hypothetical protein